MRVFVTAAAAACFVLSAPVAAQEEAPKPEKHENVSWFQIAQIDFKPGKADAAMEIIEKHYMPASREAGTPGPVMTLQHRTGSWDLTVIWHMKRGPAGMEWKRTPEGIAWQKKFVEMVGGQEEAEAIGEKFSSYIDRENVTVAMQHDAMSGGQ